jgi:Protein of unknown function (DUF3501)
MTASRRRIERADLLARDVYAQQRRERRQAKLAVKRARQISVGPYATLFFENYDTMLHQVQEMLFIEKGGEAQIEGELEAYNPLIPQGRELVATVMLEIEDPERRRRVLATLGGIESSAFIKVGNHLLRGTPEADQERTDEQGKASSVQFIRFRFAAEDIAAFRQPEREVWVGFDHPNYGHIARAPESLRAALVQDFW